MLLIDFRIKFYKNQCKIEFFVVTASQLLILMKIICFYDVFGGCGQYFV